jgi:preprotein translocase subunit SecY
MVGCSRDPWVLMEVFRGGLAETRVERIRLLGAVYHVFVALLPEILISHAALPFYIGGTSFLIVVLVALHILRDVSRSVTSQTASISATSSARAGL